MNQLIISIVFIVVNVGLGQLIVNVKNEGGEIYRENIQANTSLDTIALDFQKTDGTSVTQFIDYKNELQIFHLVILGEQELGQPLYQGLCFLLRFNKNDFISSDAMSKLRQKNPSAVRRPEEDKGVEEIEMDLLVSYEHAYILSAHIQTLCPDAKDAIYIRDKDLKLLSRSLNRDYTTLLGATKSLAVQRGTPCKNTSDSWRPCSCHYHNCIMWYPCGLKYCKGKDSTGKTVNYRCGIKTCSKCRRFEYQARRRELCMWELPDLPSPGGGRRDSDVYNFDKNQQVNSHNIHVPDNHVPVYNIQNVQNLQSNNLQNDPNMEINNVPNVNNLENTQNLKNPQNIDVVRNRPLNDVQNVKMNNIENEQIIQSNNVPNIQNVQNMHDVDNV